MRQWHLTPRELEVLRLLGEGRDPRCIAKELGVSLHTCRGYVKGILAKLDAHSQLEAVVIATRAGVIRLAATAGSAVRTPVSHAYFLVMRSIGFTAAAMDTPGFVAYLPQLALNAVFDLPNGS